MAASQSSMEIVIYPRVDGSYAASKYYSTESMVKASFHIAIDSTSLILASRSSSMRNPRQLSRSSYSMANTRVKADTSIGNRSATSVPEQNHSSGHAPGTAACGERHQSVAAFLRPLRHWQSFQLLQPVDAVDADF